MKNALTILVAHSSNQKFSRWGGFSQKIGNTIDDVTLLVPLPPDPDGKEQWLAYSKKYQFVICSPENGVPGEILKVDNVSHFLGDIKPHLGSIRQFLPKIFTFEMFESVCKTCKSNYISESVAFWNSENKNDMLICYGRLLEMSPNPNEIILLDDRIQVTKFMIEQ